MSDAKRIEELNRRAVWAHEVRPQLDRRYTVKGWLGRGGMSVVYGPSSSGKSFFALDIDQAVAKGITWHGVRVEGGPVLYIAAEGQEGFLNRVAALDGRSGLGLLILPCPVDLCRDHEGGAVLGEWLRPLAAEHGEFAKVTIDTLARSLGDGDENSGADMGAFITNVDAIRSTTGAHVMVIHHTGKDAAKGARGHSSLRAATDTEIELTTADGISTARVTKQRDGKIPEPFSYTLREVALGTDSDGDHVTTCIVEPCETPDKAPSLTANEQVVLDALHEFAADHGKLNPGGTGWPERNTVRVVCADAFRAFAAERMHQTEAKRRNEAVKRASEGLSCKGLMGANAGYVWAIHREGRRVANGRNSASASDAGLGLERSQGRSSPLGLRPLRPDPRAPRMGTTLTHSTRRLGHER